MSTIQLLDLILWAGRGLNEADWRLHGVRMQHTNSPDVDGVSF